jgi:hypothetical protein
MDRAAGFAFPVGLPPAGKGQKNFSDVALTERAMLHIALIWVGWPFSAWSERGNAVDVRAGRWRPPAPSADEPKGLTSVLGLQEFDDQRIQL